MTPTLTGKFPSSKPTPVLCLCVCVRPPLDKGFSSIFLTHQLSPTNCYHRQGAGVPLQVSCQRRRLQLAVKPDLISLAYLRFFELLPTLFQSPLFDSTVVHDTSHKPFPSAASSCRALTACECISTGCSTIQFLRTHAPFRSLAFLLNVGTDLTEYKCQSVFRSAVPLGC